MLNLLESSLFDTIAGLPLHPLVVHFAVVLLPLSALLAIAALVIGRLRRGLLTTALWLGVLGAGAALLAKESGEALARRIGEPGQHAQLGDVLPYVGAGYLVLLILWWLTSRRAVVRTTAATVPTGGATRADAVADPAPAPRVERSGGAGRVLGPLSALAALVVVVLTTLVGHTGATATWADQMAGSAPAAPAPTATPSR